MTFSEYDRAYGNESSLREVLDHVISNYSLLFLGASLNLDRTVVALKEFKEASKIEAPRHYTFLQYIDDDKLRADRIKELFSWGIHPIWYPDDGNHDQHIEDLLLSLKDGPFHD